MTENQQLLSHSIKGTPLVNYLNPAILQSMINRTDFPTFIGVTNGPDLAGCLKAMELEISTLFDMETFDVVKRLSKHKVISYVWGFKVKRFPDGSVNKLKARLCIRGFEQIEGQDYFETFSPVVQ